MNVLVIGANGQIGRILTEKLEDANDFNVTAAYRKDDQINEAQARGIRVAKVDLERDIKHLEEVMEAIDIVIFTAGSGGSTGPDKTMMIDLDGAVKTIEAAKRQNIKRFIMVSALNANRREYWSYGVGKPTPAGFYYAAKYYADDWLMKSGLTYTIIRPSALLNETGSGKVVATEYLEKDDAKALTISREDVADTIIECLKKENTMNKDFDLTSGNVPIAEAVTKL